MSLRNEAYVRTQPTPPDTITEIQQQIGTDLETARQLANVAIRCPVPTSDGRYPTATLGWLMESGGHGGELIANKLKAAANLVKDAQLDPKTALTATLAGEIETDDQGKPKVLSDHEAEKINKSAKEDFAAMMRRPQPETVGPKKK